MAVVVCDSCYCPTLLPHNCKPSPFLGHVSFHLKKLLYGRRIRKPISASRISALFWGPKKTVELQGMSFLLGDFDLLGSCSEDISTNLPKPKKISVSVVSSLSEVSSLEWDACALDTTGPEKFNPFTRHDFLLSLEESGCAVKETGWMPQHIIARDESENILGVVPLYLKSHSYGEYVFDHSWADAYYSYGSRYYPKLQCCVPFTPVTGHRILIRDSSCKDQVFGILASVLKDLAVKISAQNLTMKRLRGYEIKSRHWDTFYEFYRNTTDNKWGSPYLTRDFFHSIGSKMGDQVLLVVAEEGDEFVAGALNLIGGDTLFGRLWGCLPQTYYPSLHFEACYYQAIEAAIELNLKTVEAGAQGEHKIQRGYLPVTTYSCHYIVDENFRKAIDDFLVREAAQVKLVMQLLHDSGPFKDGIH